MGAVARAGSLTSAGLHAQPPCNNCFRDLLMALDVDAFKDVLSRWAEETLELSPEDLQAVSLDYKSATNLPHLGTSKVNRTPMQEKREHDICS